MDNADRIGKVREALDQAKSNNTVALTLLPKLPSSIDEIVSALEASYERVNAALALLTVEVECGNCGGDGDLNAVYHDAEGAANVPVNPCLKCDGSGKVSVPLEETL